MIRFHWALFCISITKILPTSYQHPPYINILHIQSSIANFQKSLMLKKLEIPNSKIQPTSVYSTEYSSRERSSQHSLANKCIGIGISIRNSVLFRSPISNQRPAYLYENNNHSMLWRWQGSDFHKIQPTPTIQCGTLVIYFRWNVNKSCAKLQSSLY